MLLPNCDLSKIVDFLMHGCYELILITIIFIKLSRVFILKQMLASLFVRGLNYFSFIKPLETITRVFCYSEFKVSIIECIRQLKISKLRE